MPSTIVGAIAGGQQDKSEQKSSSGINLSDPTALENQGKNSLTSAFSDITNMVNAGPGQNDTSAAYNAQQGLAGMLDQFSKGGYQPTDVDISGANGLAAKLFQGQQTALNQSFQNQSQDAARQAALMGRDINDPVLRAKLAYQQTQQQQQLSANQGAWATQYAMQQPMQRLSFMQDKTNLLSGLATQAMANRQALASMGQGIMNNERDFRLQTGTRWGDSTQTSGGGLKGALMGGMAGLGQDMKLGSMMFTGGATGAAPGGAMPAPTSNPFGMSTAGSFASSPMFAGGGYGRGSYA